MYISLSRWAGEHLSRHLRLSYVIISPKTPHSYTANVSTSYQWLWLRYMNIKLNCPEHELKLVDKCRYWSCFRTMNGKMKRLLDPSLRTFVARSYRPQPSLFGTSATSENSRSADLNQFFCTNLYDPHVLWPAPASFRSSEVSQIWCYIITAEVFSRQL